MPVVTPAIGATAADVSSLADGTAEADVLRPRFDDDRRLAIALTAAVMLHVMPFVIAAVGVPVLAPILAVMGISMPSGDPEPIGDEKGRIDSVNVEVIDDADFEKRFVSFAGGREAATVDAQPSPPPQPPVEEANPEQQQSPPAEERSETPTDTAEAAAPLFETRPTLPPEVAARPDPPKPEPPKAEPRKAEPQRQQPQQRPDTVSEKDIAELYELTRPDRTMIRMIESASGARKGVMSEFTRTVVRLIKASLPEPRGVKGLMEVGFIIGDAGEPTRITLLRASGFSAFDQLVMQRIAGVRFPVPGRGVRPDERVVRFTYEFN